jgi:hypothetical protein
MIQPVDKLQPGFQRRLHESSNLTATIVDLVATAIYKIAAASKAKKDSVRTKAAL